MKDGTLKDVSEYKLQVVISEKIKLESFSGYSLLPIKLGVPDIYKIGISGSQVNSITAIVPTIDKLYIDLNFPQQIIGMRLVLPLDGKYIVDFGQIAINLFGEIDTIEKVVYYWEDQITTNTRDFELYLRKEYVDPIDEINWDSNTNAFAYNIQQQFYEIIPNPVAATTLYIDYNITSSKIITADNITTMRTDINVLTNNFDVVSYDVKEISANVET